MPHHAALTSPHRGFEAAMPSRRNQQEGEKKERVGEKEGKRRAIWVFRKISHLFCSVLQPITYFFSVHQPYHVFVVSPSQLHVFSCPVVNFALLQRPTHPNPSTHANSRISPFVATCTHSRGNRARSRLFVAIDRCSRSSSFFKLHRGSGSNQMHMKTKRVLQI